MRGMALGVMLALAACGTSSTARDGGEDGGADTGVHLQFDGGLEAGQSDAGDDTLVQDDSGTQTDAEQGDSMAQSDATSQSDVLLQTDALNYTPGECNPSADTCLGAPAYPCRYSTGDMRFMCPCVPGANPNCRVGEFCCMPSVGAAVCYEYETAPCR